MLKQVFKAAGELRKTAERGEIRRQTFGETKANTPTLWFKVDPLCSMCRTHLPSTRAGGGEGYTVVYDAPQFQLNLQRKSLRSSLTTVGSFAAVLLVSPIGFVGGDNSNLWSFQPGTMLSEPTEMLIGLMQIRANHISIMCELLTDWLMTYFSLIVAASSRRRITDKQHKVCHHRADCFREPCLS